MIKMHEHDFDLIAAHAEGTASPEQAVTAEGAIARCDDCNAEFEAQRHVLELLRSVAPVAMTDVERASLHRSLRQAAPAPRTGWLVRYAPRVAAVAAGFAVVGLASVAMLGNGFGGDTSDMTALDTAAAELIQDAPGDGEEKAPSLASSAEESRSVAESAADDAASAAGGSEDHTLTAPVAGLPVLEITAADLQDLAGPTPPVELLESYAGFSDEVAARCSGYLPDQVELVLAAEVLFEQQPAYLIIYATGGDTVAAALSSEDCAILGEFTAGQ